ncbi:hypothetical protein BV25DRAFT_1875200 [Artomyces pyxidatus]|uniref:Uncharacterized protein n=1 Tax=Artomyces pyxidatus TaxID=48021 RepID=A0ACB8TI40_9AGAM|nr:hypothetical protein BV25DRAFT_1875200 [Artomyces pyxidatus]
MVSSELFDLLRGYSALFPPRVLRFPSNASFAEVHDFLLHSILLNPHLERYPPSSVYQSSFWKCAIEHLEGMLGEEASDELDERIYERKISLVSTSCPVPLSQNSMAPPPPSFVTHIWRPQGYPASGSSETVDPQSHSSVTLFESRTTIESGTTGLRTWRASFALANYLIGHPDLVAGKKVLELGSGAGFLGLVMADIQTHCDGTAQSALQLTDFNEDVLNRCTENVQLPCNASSSCPNVTVTRLDWSDAVDPSRSPSLQAFLTDFQPDLLVGADLLYGFDMIQPLLATLHLALRASATAAYLCLAVRNEDVLHAFLSAAVTAGHPLSVEELPLGHERPALLIPEEIVGAVKALVISLKA